MTAPVTRVPFDMRQLPVAIGSGLTHRGMVRENNEDSILTDPDGVLWAVADGMGGYGNGDVASDIVMDCLSAIDDTADPAEQLAAMLEIANERVRAVGAEQNLGTIGATVVALLIQNAIGNVAWAGDSRAYLMRSDKLRLLTRDHTVVQDLVESGALNPDDAEHHPESHIVTRAVGGAEELEVDHVTVPLIIGDRLLLCSDGLTACVDEHSIAQALEGESTPEAVCRTLVAEALQNGAPDNVSVITVFIQEA